MSGLKFLRIGITALLLVLAIAAIRDADALRKVRQDNGQQQGAATPASASLRQPADRAAVPAVIRTAPLLDPDKLV